MKRKQNSFTALVLASLLALSVYGCSRSEAQTATAPPVAVNYITLKNEAVSLEQELAGRVKSSLHADVRPRVDGIIKEMLFKEGQYIEAEQVLYKLDDESYKAAYNQAYAALKSAEASLEAAKVKDSRYNELAKINGISAQEADDAHATHLQASATVLERKAALETARINLARTEIKAPISGYIGISNYTTGALVNANQAAAMAAIRSVDTVYIDMTRSTAQVQELKRMYENRNVSTGSMEVTLKLDNGEIYKHKGELQLQEIAVSESTGTVTLRASFPNPDRELMPGMYVRAIIETGVDNNAILADQRGITWDVKGNATALVLTSGSTVEKRTVTVTQVVGDKWLVTDGLNDGDMLIIGGVSKVRNGSPVRAIDSTPGG